MICVICFDGPIYPQWTSSSILVLNLFSLFCNFQLAAGLVTPDLTTLADQLVEAADDLTAVSTRPEAQADCGNRGEGWGCELCHISFKGFGACPLTLL